jgi:hypothetical protein
MITALIGVLAPILGKVLDRIPNPAEREKVRLEVELQLRAQEAELIKLFAANDIGQLEVNKTEAASSSLFVAGWRPFVGWTCGAGVAWTFVLKPLADWALAIWAPHVVTPVLQSGELMSLLLGMLGMGAIRSYEKVKGVASK